MICSLKFRWDKTVGFGGFARGCVVCTSYVHRHDSPPTGPREPRADPARAEMESLAGESGLH